MDYKDESYVLSEYVKIKEKESKMDRKNDIPENAKMGIAASIYVVFTICLASIVCGILIFVSSQYDKELDKSRQLNKEIQESRERKHQHLKDAIKTGDYSRYFPDRNKDK